MKVSFDGVGQVCATFFVNDPAGENAAKLAEGQVAKLAGNGMVGPCGAGDSFCGAVLCRKDDACTVQVCGFVTVAYSGTAPAVGWTALCADGTGGVKAGGEKDTGARQIPVVDVNESAKTVTILL